MENATSLPEGTITFLFSDMEGSTLLLQSLGDRYPAVLAEHQRLLRGAFDEWGGCDVDSRGEEFFVAFSRASDAVSGALAAQRALVAHPWPEGVSVRVRMGLHTGEPVRTPTGYVGLDVHRAARLMAAGHGGQILLSQSTRFLVEQDLPEGASLRDLGPHRLKDLRNPEPVYQVLHPALPAEFPPLKSLDAYPNNLRVQPTGLLGREQELATLGDLLRREEVRLLTLTGPGGCGKTRLGTQLAADLLDDFREGAYVVALGPISDPGLVPTVIAQALGLQEAGGRPTLDSLKGYLQDKQILLLLDNFEQLLPAASVVVELLAACPQLKVLVTSRSRLHLRGEKEFRVPPLALPNARRLPPLQTLSQYGSVALFIQRARDVQHDFTVTNENAPAVAEICHRLDGLPLAIELAAARIRLLTPQAMLARLTNRLNLLTGGARDLPARQRTLREAIAWSYDLLEEGEQRLFRRLSIFVGGCTFESAEAVAGASTQGAAPAGAGHDTVGDLEIDLLDGLESLASQSLLRQEVADGGEPRFVMLETIREYGREKLQESGEAAAIRGRHLQYFLTLAETAETRLTSEERSDWLARLETEHDNLRSALEWAQESKAVEDGLRLAGALSDFWQVRGYWAEGQQRFAGLLALPGAEARTAARARALYPAGRLAYCRGEIAAARSLYEESLAINLELEDERGTAASLNGLGDVTRLQGDLDRARSLYEESMALYRKLGDRWRVTFALSGLGDVARLQGDLEAARSRYQESLTLRRELGDKQASTISLNGLGHVARLQGNLQEARSRYTESLTINRELGDRRGTTFSLGGLANVARLQGELDTAGALYEESLVINRELGDKRGIASSLGGLADVARRQDDLERARSLYEQSLALQRELGDKPGIVESLNGLALVIREQGDDAAARSLCDEALTLRQELQPKAGVVPSPHRPAAVAQLQGDDSSLPVENAERGTVLDIA
jgi:predicted ATPase/class 3 adenylate cyclase